MEFGVHLTKIKSESDHDDSMGLSSLTGLSVLRSHRTGHGSLVAFVS